LARARRKVRAKQLSFTGLPLGTLISLNIDNALNLQARYQDLTVKTSFESLQVDHLKPLHLPEDDLEIMKPFKVECETVLVDARRPDFSFRNHLMLDDSLNVFFSDLTPREQVVAFREYVPRRVNRLSGTMAYLSNTWVDNYYHWMQLTLPLLRLYEKLSPALKPDYYYIGESRLQGVQLETLARLGIRPNQIIREAASADRLLAAFYLHRPQHAGARFRDIWGHEFVRNLFWPVTPKPDGPKRIYLTRRDAGIRRLSNEDELVEYLRGDGFVPITLSGMSVAHQAEFFAGAEYIVAVHGAALTNLLFVQDGTKLVEIFPAGYEDAGHYAAATYRRLNYAYLLAAYSGKDIRIDLKKLGDLMEMQNA
jgi:capsular polysaccharide biosynthesis protein